MVCIIRGVGGVHRVVYGSVVSIEGYTGPEWAPKDLAFYDISTFTTFRLFYAFS